MMNDFSPERWREIDRLFAGALERPPDARTAFLRRACGDDPGLYEAVDALLEHEAEAARVLGESVSQFAAPLLPALEAAWTGEGNGALLAEGRVGPYRIIREIGRGGMGTVYLARDTRLDRRVALKFLPPHLRAAQEAKERFMAEARAASALDHPHIATLYEVDETDDGRLFIAMAYYAGQTLKQKLAPGPLAVENAVKIALQVADGLAAAHRKGIVHRDVKPANVLVTEGGMVKLVDFGLVKMAGVNLTKQGRTMGTVAYMSPEQARGEAVDARTDCWALGVVLYEMLTGRQPFRGAREQAVIHSILHVDPEPVASLQSDVPDALARIVEQALAKDPEKRYQEAGALRADLRLLDERRPLPARRWERGKLQHRQWAYEYGAGGLLLVLLVVLGVFFATGRDPAATDAIAGLPLDHRSGDPPEDRAPPADETPPPSSRALARAAYERGRALWWTRRGAGAYDQFRLAVEHDSTFALGYVGLADGYAFSYQAGAEAKAALAQALALDPDLGEAHATLGFVYMLQDWNWSKAEAALEQARRRVPSYTPALQWTATLRMIQRRPREAEALLRRALLTAPPEAHALLHADRCQALYYARAFDEALIACQQALRIDPHNPFAKQFKRQILLATDRPREEAALIAQDRSFLPTSEAAMHFRRRVAAGGTPALLRFLTESLDPSSNPSALFQRARLLARLGKRDAALDELTRAVAVRQFHVPFANADPAFDSIRNTPRFRALMNTVGLAK